MGGGDGWCYLLAACEERRTEQFGSRASECGLDTMLEFVLRKESTSGCGPNENELNRNGVNYIILEGDGLGWGMLHTNYIPEFWTWWMRNFLNH